MVHQESQGVLPEDHPHKRIDVTYNLDDDL
jgi:hypothetical protein